LSAPYVVKHDDGTLGLGRMSLLMIRAAVCDACAGPPVHQHSAIEWLSNRDDGFISFDSACQHLATLCERLPLASQESLRDVPHFGGNDLTTPEAWRTLSTNAIEDKNGARDWVVGSLLRSFYHSMESARDERAMLNAGLENTIDSSPPSNQPRSATLSRSKGFER